MAKQTTFGVSKKGTEGFEVTFDAPERLDDPRWAELGVSAEGINELALQNLIIKIQGGARSRLENGKQAVQDFVNNYKYGQRAAGVTRVAPVAISKDEAKAAKFTPAQLEMLAKAGVKIEGVEAATA